MSFQAVFLTSQLNSAQKAEIQSILDRSRAKESVSASFPFDEADFYALCTVDNVVRSAAAFVQEDEELYECCAFTDPEYRGEGMFSSLINAALNELPEDVEFIFYTNGKSKDCLAVLEAFEAENVLEEHMMEIDTARFAGELAHQNESALSVGSEFMRTEIDVDGTKTWHYVSSYGVVNISVFSSYYYLYGFEIQETFRGQGHGKVFLRQVLNDLANRNPWPLRLQVSGDNLPAISLYKKTGFQITETLFGYLY